MDWIESSLRRLAAALSRTLDPVAYLLERLDFSVRRQMDLVGVPFAWRSAIIAAVWVVVLFLVFRVLSGWWRVALLVTVAVVLGRVYGLYAVG